jgi:hypothetical protein
MFARKVLCLLAGVVILGALATSPTLAMGDSSHRTYFTFSQPVHLPGVLLPAGTYVFELAVPTQSSNLVRVTNRKSYQVFLLAFTNQVERPADRNLDAAIVLGETSGHSVPPIKVWYPQGERTGHQFIY